MKGTHAVISTSLQVQQEHAKVLHKGHSRTEATRAPGCETVYWSIMMTDTDTEEDDAELCMRELCMKVYLVLMAAQGTSPYAGWEVYLCYKKLISPSATWL